MAASRAQGRYPHARRRHDRAHRRARRTAILVLAGLAVLVTLFLAAFGSAPTSGTPAVSQEAASLLASGRPLPEVVAVQGTLRIQLPVAQNAVTALGYHGAGEDALPLDPVGRRINEGLFTRIWHRMFGGGGGRVAYYQLPGGEGPRTGGLDVGAPAGTEVFAPVDGAVVSIRDYVVDGKAYGHRIALQPSGAPSVVVWVSHLEADPELTVGAPVTAGSTRIGAVLDFSAVEEQALARFTKDAGNHVTLEVHPAATLSLR